MNSLISICIPACNRPLLLAQAIESCFLQEYRPLEILIGDDSIDGESEIVSKSARPPEGIVLRYERNRPGLGQAGNVNRLFDKAVGERLLLLHDDDLLCPNALDRLAQAWAQTPAPLCVYGKQIIIDPFGATLKPETQSWNERYFRIEEHAGPQSSPLVAALWQQVPNNCYLVDAAIARSTRYKPETDIGQCVDAEFVIRLGQRADPGAFVFVDRLVSKYRLTPASIARSKTINRRQDLFFEIVESVKGDSATENAKEILLKRIAVGASLDAAMAARRQVALRIVFSRYYTLPLVSRWTLYRILAAFSPALGAKTKHLADQELLPRLSNLSFHRSPLQKSPPTSSR